MKMRKWLLIGLMAVSSVATAQTDYASRYQNAKEFYTQGKYALAMESFKALIAYDKDNPFSAYSSFYYSLSAYHQNYKAVAKDMLNQIKVTHAGWDQMPEVDFWIGKILLESGDYFQGIKILNSLPSSFEADAANAKRIQLAGVQDAETLRMLLEEYPRDQVIAKALASVLQKKQTEPEVRRELENLISRYDLDKKEYLSEAPSTFFKDEYSVSVLLPFNVNTLDPSPGRKRNQLVLDFWEGMKLAADTLRTQGVNISLRAYDTERSTEKTAKYLQTEELQNTDLIVGPFFPEEVKLVNEFSRKQKINAVNPFTNSSEVTEGNPFSFLFQPSAETMGVKSAEFVSGRARKKSCMIIYGPTKKDSVMAANFAKTARQNGLRIVYNQRFDTKNSVGIQRVLATPTEYDEFKYPRQFTLKKDSIGSIYVATDESLIYSKVIGSVETRGDSILVLGQESWLNDLNLDFQKLEALKIFLAAPNHTDAHQPAYKDFAQRYIQRFGKTPSTSAEIGFELMMIFGLQLKTHGVFFQNELTAAGLQPGIIGAGYNYSNGNDNQVIPIVTFQNGAPVVVEKK